MITVEVDEKTAIATLSPSGSLTESDFEIIRNVIDPFIESYGRLSGIIIQAKKFPGWQSFSSLVSHLTFVKNHHKEVERVAIVSDSPLATLAQSLGRHFVSADIRRFSYRNIDVAKQWLGEAKTTTA